MNSSTKRPVAWLVIVVLTSLTALTVEACASAPAQDGSERVSLDAYAEWRRDDTIIVDGQRVRTGAATTFEGERARQFSEIQLGDEVRLTGVRLGDGSVLATELEAKVNGSALFEGDVRAATDEIEALWLKEGMMFEPKEDGGREVIGTMVTSGPKLARVERITRRMLPPYLPAEAVRVHVVETDEWNAAAMGNGAVWVYTGLIDELSDDELAIVIGHELAHFTHEHSRRGARSGLLTQLLGLGALVAAEAIDNDVLRTSAQVAALLSMTATLSNYSRNHEDQADRVGLRYVSEAGFDVGQGPHLWARFRDKYGEQNPLVNFFLGSHSRPTDRIRNIERELALNYR
ncbi:MAG: M48 family metalloprotease [Acidobacteria bacterium]|nr:M48 family metalloprotease [Acidobacteriota bacterium]